MTTTDRTVRVLRESLDRIWGYDAPDWADTIAYDLHAAGLLAPDLPPVIVDDFDECPHVTITGTHAKDKARLRVNEHGAFHAINAWSDPMNPAEARERAYALLALANYSEGDHR